MVGAIVAVYRTSSAVPLAVTANAQHCRFTSGRCILVTFAVVILSAHCIECSKGLGGAIKVCAPAHRNRRGATDPTVERHPVYVSRIMWRWQGFLERQDVRDMRTVMPIRAVVTPAVVVCGCAYPRLSIHLCPSFFLSLFYDPSPPPPR
ncbi:hypothetical protein BC628DRAFT_1149802 [Trametes gibbosa]|nr:hypothetical protein BC628DRAFT_1149802 [Trametes gibbosa]